MKYLVIDGGIFTDHANALSDNGKNEVLYWTDWAAQSYPKLQDFAPGTGYDYLKKVLRLFDIDFKSMDCIVNFDVGQNDLIAKIRKEYPNLSIFGAGKGEILEEDREGLKKWCDALGLDVQPYKILFGIDALEEYCKSRKDLYVKIDIFRASMETLHIESYEQAVDDGTFIEMREEFGPVFSKKIKFIVEQAIKSEVEIGFDGFFCPAGGYLNKCLAGYEYKKGPIIDRVYDADSLPACIAETMDAFAPILERMDYRGALSTEEKVVKDGRHFLLDWCSRLLAPGSSLYPYAIKNWSELIYSIGKNDPVDIEIDYKYVGALPLFCDDGKEHYINIRVDPKYRDVIRMRSVCSDGKKYWSVKGNEGMVTCVAGGESVDEVIGKLKELVDKVDFEGKDENYSKILDEFPKIIKEGKEAGIDF